MALFHTDIVKLDPEQFDKLVELLTPGYELAKMYMAQMQPAEDPPAEDPPQGFRKSAPAPDFDDPSKQGSG